MMRYNNDTYLAFYKGRKCLNDNSKMLDNLVCYVDGSDYSHVEFAVKKTNVYVCYSSSFRDGGVRQRAMKLNPDHWHLIKVDVDYAWAMIVFNAFRDYKYDYMGLLSTKWDFFPNITNRIICSALVSAMLGLPNYKCFGVKELYDLVSNKTDFTYVE